jgi:hypothetical protein
MDDENPIKKVNVAKSVETEIDNEEKFKTHAGVIQSYINKHPSLQKYKLQIAFLVVSLIMIATLQFLAVPMIIITYILVSVVNNILAKKQL